MRRYDTDGDGKINDKEEKVGSRRIAIEYKRKFKALRPPPGDMKARSRSTRRGMNARNVDIMKRLKTLKKFKKALTACSENPKGKGCVSLHMLIVNKGNQRLKPDKLEEMLTKTYRT